MNHECRPLKIALLFSISISIAAAQVAKPAPALQPATAPSSAPAQSPGPAANALSTEMITAARNGDVAAVKQLLAKGEDVNATNSDGVTALMIAGAEDHLNVVLALLEAGADARMKTLSGKTAEFFASGRGHAEVAAVLNDAASKPPFAPTLSDASKSAPPDASKSAPPDASKSAPPDASKSAPPDASKSAPPDASRTASPDASKSAPPDASRTASPDATKTPRDPAQAIEHYNKGLALYNAGPGHYDEKAAEEEFRLAAAYAPSMALAYYLRGQVLVRGIALNKDGTWQLPPGLLESYQTYLALDPNGTYSKDVRGILTSMHQPLASPDVDAKVAAIREQKTNPVQSR